MFVLGNEVTCDRCDRQGMRNGMTLVNHPAGGFLWGIAGFIPFPTDSNETHDMGRQSTGSEVSVCIDRAMRLVKL